jgi:site-specific DNA-methyltransferase (adenine-specific)
MNESLRFEFWNEDAITGAQKRIPDDSVDCVVTDPPFGIDGARVGSSYNRDEGFVVDGYVEVPSDEYAEFSANWVGQAERILRPGGSLIAVSGYSNLHDILNALHWTSLREVNHIVWKYNFGVYTTRKFVSSHYHLLYWCKPPDKKRTFNRCARFSPDDKTEKGGSVLYRDLEDVWAISREYKPGQVKNKNCLPHELVKKILQYCTSERDLVCDFFLGSFAVAKVAKGIQRSCIGFELNKAAFTLGEEETNAMRVGEMLPDLLRGEEGAEPGNRGRPWSDGEVRSLVSVYRQLCGIGMKKKEAVENLCSIFGRGRFSIERVLRKGTHRGN